MMAVSNNDNEPITHHFLKTFFMLEKVNAIDPQTGNTTQAIVLFDAGNGPTGTFRQ